MTQLLGLGFGRLNTRLPQFATADVSGVAAVAAAAGGGSGGGGGEQRTPLFFSDWREQEDGSSSTSRTDGGKWSVSRFTNGRIIDAPADFPCHKVTRIQSDDGANACFTAMTVTGLGELGIGNVRNWRFYMQYLNPDGETPNFHGIGDSQAIGSKNWDINAVYDNDGGWGFCLNFEGFGSRFGTWPFGWGGSIVNGEGGLLKTGCYRFEMQMVRISSGNARFHCWVYHRASGVETLVYDDASLVCDSTGEDWENLADYNAGNNFSVRNPATTGQFMMGHNGVTPDPSSLPFIHSDQAACAIVDGLEEEEPIGAYGLVEGEQPRT